MKKFIVAFIISFLGVLWCRKKNPQEVRFSSKRISPIHHYSLLGHFETIKHPKSLIVLAIVSIFFGSLLDRYAFIFKASLIDLGKTEFTGTVSPISSVPKWTELTEAERKMSYNQIPKSKMIPIPAYDLTKMRVGQVWTASNANERNTYITYPVPNLGNYKLDGTENSGSHPGVDIKVPTGTPIMSIANGIVYKTQNLSTGYGKAVSIAHVKIPESGNSEEKITLVSTYAHLSKINVKEGQIVKKGQVIALSGNSGMSTNPHLHFQIDRSNAPFIPYWPFSWKDIQSQGYDSFFEGVKHGVGKINAIKHTVHPIHFIEDNKNLIVNEENLVASSAPPVISDQIVDQKIEKEENRIIKKEAPKTLSSAPKTEPQTPEKKQEERKIIKKQKNANRFESNTTFVPGEEASIKFYVNERSLADNTEINISSTLKKLVTLNPQILTKKDFKEGVATIKFQTQTQHIFKIIAQGSFGEIKSSNIKPSIFKDVSFNDTYADAISYLKENKIINGYPDKTFKPQNTINRAEALKIVMQKDTDPTPPPFSDVPKNSWFTPYVSQAFNKKIVKGYGNGEFRPSNQISRAEFLKIAILKNKDEDLTKQEETSLYPDVENNAWFAPYFSFAKKHDLINTKENGNVTPNIPITRAEAAYVIYQINQI